MSLDILGRDRAFVIAEAGTCHAYKHAGGRVGLALAYVDAAVAAGVDAIKFQMFRNPIPDDMFCWIDGDSKRVMRWAQTELHFNKWRIVKARAESLGLVFLASAFQNSTVDWLGALNVDATKVASRAATNFPYERAPKPFLISTGMEYPAVEGAIYLECESNYPSTAQWTGKFPGFSDHSGTPWRAIDAIARGCKLVEVHFYIDPEDAGPDLPASLDRDQLKLVCEARDAFAEINA